MNEIEFKKINTVLVDWDPLEINEPAVWDEYTSLVPKIYETKKDKDELFAFLVSSLISLGLDYDESNIEHKKDVEGVVTNIQKLFV